MVSMGPSTNANLSGAHETINIGRHNIPDELVALLQKLSVNELVDFALGSDGRWYVKYRQKGFDRHGEPKITYRSPT